MKVTQSPSNKVLVFKCQWTFLLLTIQKCYQIVWLKFEDCVEKEGRGWGRKSTKTLGKSDQSHPLHWWKHVEDTCSHSLEGEVRISLSFSVHSWGFSHTDLLFLRISESALAPMRSQQLISLCSRRCYHITSPTLLETSKVLLVFEISVKYHFLRVNFSIRKDKTRSSPPSFL